MSESEAAEIYASLDRLDRASAHGPWTGATLSPIERSPGSAASGLARELGLPADVFKPDVRKLKALGLTISLQTGYRVSPGGTAFLRSGRS